jgi:hypothetical protein
MKSGSRELARFRGSILGTPWASVDQVRSVSRTHGTCQPGDRGAAHRLTYRSAAAALSWARSDRRANPNPARTIVYARGVASLDMIVAELDALLNVQAFDEASRPRGLLFRSSDVVHASGPA